MLLNSNKEMTSKLREFVVRSVEKWVVGHEPKKAIRELDSLTINLPIPSNYNIVAQLPVRQLLLLCKRSRRYNNCPSYNKLL